MKKEKVKLTSTTKKTILGMLLATTPVAVISFIPNGGIFFNPSLSLAVFTFSFLVAVCTVLYGLKNIINKEPVAYVEY